ncbi:MAG: alpha-N-acetylglucosaminidase [Ginsengibacter sp.]
MRKLIAILLLLVIITNVRANDFNGVQDLVARRIPWLKSHIVFKELRNVANSEDAFTLQTKNGKLIVSATSPNAASMAVNWYLKYYCHQSLSLQTENIFPLKELPQIDGMVTQKTPYKYRYSLNYCTISYTMSFYKWPRWSYVLDWLALNGVNIALAPVGTEKIWDLTLQDFNFSKKEREAFIPGPAFSAWWLMGNLEGWGGPESDVMMNQQVALQKEILARMKDLGIRPVMQGFYGMVPNELKQKYPSARIIDQGKWAGGFVRPAILSPEDSLFTKMAGSYYHHIQDLYGKDFHFFGGDPFHEGGSSKGIDLEKAGSDIYTEMHNYFSKATWVLQGWSGNPKEKLIAKIPADKVLILDLMGENYTNFITRNGYNGHDWIFGSVNNFGENTGFIGKLKYLSEEPFKTLQIPEGKSLVGIGEIPEGYNNNPVLYDLIYDVAWQPQPFDLKSWIKKYADFRYGKTDVHIQSAWQVFLNTIYTSDLEPQQGAPESIFCARPSTKAEHARTWGTLKTSYDTKAFEKAVNLFASSAYKFKGIATYQYDLIDLTRQVISNKGMEIYKLMISAFNANNKQDFRKYSDEFLKLMRMQDNLLLTDRDFRLSTWINSAYDFGQTPEDKKLAVRNAKIQISYWGSNNPKTDLHDYANKEWGGLIGTLYLQRWQQFINYLNEKLEGKEPQEPDYFTMEKEWADSPYQFRVPSKEDAVTKSLSVLKGLDVINKN